MDISLNRQHSLMLRLEDFFVNWTQYDMLRKEITPEERTWMFDWVSRRLGLPNLPSMLTNRRIKKENATMAHQGSIVQRHEGKTIPDDFLTIASGTDDQYLGYALPGDGDLDIGQMEGDYLTDIKETMSENTYAFTVIFAKGADTEESKQPFNTLQNEGGNCICASFIEGDLQGFGAPETSHSIEFAAHQEYLGPKIIDIFTSNDEDLTKTVEKLNTPFVKREIMNACFPTPDGRGEILIVFANGQRVSIVKGDKHKKYEWGEVSQSYAYEGKAVETKPAEVKRGLGSKKTDMKVDPKSLPDKTPEKTDTAIAAALKNAEDNSKKNLDYMVVPPTHRLSSIKDAQAWYRVYSDTMPDDSDIQIMVTTKQPIAVKIKGAVSNNVFNRFLQDKKLMLAADKGKAPAATKSEAAVVVPVSIIPETERENLMKNFLPKMVKAFKNFDDGSRLIVPPEKILSYMRDKPVATMQLGIDKGLDEFENYSDEAFRMLGKMAPDALAALCSEYRLDRIKNKAALVAAAGIKKAM